MENDYVDFKFDDHWASEFNLVAVSDGDRYNPPIYGSVNSNTTTVMGKTGVYKWESQVNEKVFSFNIAFDNVTIAQLNQIKQWLEPHKVAKLTFAEEPYKYYWVALNDEVNFSHLPFIENEKMVGDRKVIEGVYKGEIAISFICVANDGYSEEGNYEGITAESELKTISGNNFIITDADDDNIENIKIEGYSEQEVKLNNDLTDVDFEDANNTWEVNNLATFSAENEEITVNAPYEFSGIAQEQREAIIGHKYYASAEVNTDSLDTALEVAGKNITNSKSGQTIEIDDGLIGRVDDLRVEGNSQQETKYNNEINSSFLEDLDNWDTINNGTVTRSKQEATITAQNQFDGITQNMEESNIGDKYYISAKVQADDTAALEVETQTGTAQGETIELSDSADRELQEFKLYGKSEQESYVETNLGQGESINYNNSNNYNKYTKVEVTGKTEQETRAESGTTVTGEQIHADNIELDTFKLQVKGNSYQESRAEAGTTVTGEQITVNDVTSTGKKIKVSGNVTQTIYSGSNLVQSFGDTLPKTFVSPESNYTGLWIYLDEKFATKYIEQQCGFTLKVKCKEPKTKAFSSIALEDNWNRRAQFNEFTSRVDNEGYTIYECYKVYSTMSLQNNKFIIIWEGSETVETGCILYDISVELENTVGNDIEPYCGGQISPNIDYPQEIKTVGSDINLFDKDNANILKANLASETQINANPSVSNRLAYIPIKANTTYTVQKRISTYFTIGTTEVVPNFGVAYYQRIQNKNATNLTITTSATAKYLIIWFWNSADTLTEQEIIDSIKIQQGSIATSYSPYNMGTTNVIISNKNLLDIQKNAHIEKNGLIIDTDENGILTINGTANVHTYLKLYGKDLNYTQSSFDTKKKIKAGTYTLTTKLLTNVFESNMTCLIRNATAGGKTYVDMGRITQSQTKSKTFTLTEDLDGVIYIWIANGTTLNNAKIQIQLEKGSTATTYTPNQQQSFTIPVQQEMLADDYFDLKNQKEIHIWKKLIFDGTGDNFEIANSKDNSTYFTSKNEIFEGIATSATPIAYCNLFMPVRANILWGTDTLGFTFATTGKFRINLPNTIASTVAELNTWLSTHNVIVYGKLPTPEKLTLTSAQITALNNLQNSDIYLNTTNIYSNNELSPNIELKYNYITSLPNIDEPKELESVGNDINLFNKDTITNNMYVAENGNLIEQEGICISDYIPIEPNTYYYTTTRGSWQSVGYYDSSKTFIIRGLVTPGATQTPENAYYARYNMPIENINTFKISKGSRISPWSPYQQGSIDLIIYNNNLKDFSNIPYIAANGATVSKTNDIYTITCASSQWGSVRFEQSNLKLKPNTTYTFSAKIVSTESTIGSAVYVAASLNNTNTQIFGTLVTAGNRSYVTFTTPSIIPNDSIIGLYPRESNKTASFTDIQIEQNSTMTEYTEYMPQEFIIPCQQPLRKIGDYADTFIKINNTWYEKRLIGKAVINSVYLDTTQNKYKKRFNQPIPNALQCDTTHNSAYCNRLQLLPSTSTYYNQEGFTITEESKFYFYIEDWNKYTVEEANAKLAETPIEVYYPMSAPQFIPCTALQITALTALEQAELYKPVTNIVSMDSISPNLSFKYNYLSQLPSIETPSEIKTVGSDENNIIIKLNNKNLLNLNNRVLQRSTGVTVTNRAVNSFDMQGTSTWSNYTIVFENKNKNTDYCINTNLLSGFARRVGLTVYGNNTLDVETANLIRINSVGADLSANTKTNLTVPFNSGNYNYLVFRFWNNNSATSLSTSAVVNVTDMMWEVGTTSTDYITSQEKTITFPLAQGQTFMEGDYLAKDGIHHKKKQVKLNNITDYGMGTSMGLLRIYYDFDDIYEYTDEIGHIDKIISSHYTLNTASNYGNIFQYKKRIIACPAEGITTKAQYEEWLTQQQNNGTPVTIEYELATEQIEAYTAQQLSAYNQLAYLMLYEGYNTIYSTNTIEPTLKWLIPKSPSPDYPIEINSIGSNINLFDKNTMGTRIYRYFADTNRWLTANDSYSIAIPCEPYTTYTLSHLNTNSTIFRCGYIKESTIPSEGTITVYEGFIDNLGTTRNYTIQTGENATFIIFQAGSNQMLDVIETFKLEKGSRVTPYSEYERGNTNMVVRNKNFLDISNITEGNVLGLKHKVEGDKLKLTGTIASSGWITIGVSFTGLEPGTYRFSYVSSGTIPQSIKVLDLSYQQKNNTFTVSSSSAGYMLAVSGNVGDVYDGYVQLQIEKGSTATSYTEHKEQNLTMPCQQPIRAIGTVKDCFFKNTIDSEFYNSELDLDCWYEMHNIGYYKFTGNETWNSAASIASGTSRFYMTKSDSKNQLGQEVISVKSNRFSGLTWKQIYSTDTTTINAISNYSQFNTTDHRIVIRIDSNIASTISQLKAYLSNNFTYAEYILENPTYIKCTQTQTNILDSLQTYRNKTTFYSEDLIQPTLALTYVKNPTIQVQTNGTSQQTLSTLYTQQINNGRILISNLADGANSIKFTNPVEVNLTKQFGSGNEPTKEWCDQNLTFVNCAEGGAPSPETPSPIWNVGDNINLFDKNSIIENYELYSSNGTSHARENWYITDWIEIKPNEQYTISGTKTAGPSNCWYDKNKNFIYTDSLTVGTIKSPSTARYLRFNGLLTELDDIKFEAGNIASPYSAYGLANIDTIINTGYETMIKSFPLTSGQKLLAGDYIDEDGIHHLKKQVIFDGSNDEEWKHEFIFSGNNFYTTLPDASTNHQMISVLSNYFKYYPEGSLQKHYSVRISNGNARFLNLRHQDYDNVVDFRQWLSTHPTIIEYTLQIPEIESFTTAQQEWYDNFMIYTKQNTISTQATIKPYYSFTYDIDDTYNVQSTKTGEFEKLGLIFDNLEDRPRFIVDNIGETASQFTMRNPIVVDLTNEYGAGHEPNLAWCQENINNLNTCEYGTPSPKVPNEPYSIGINPIKIETKGRNILDEGELINWTTHTCEVEKLTEKYESRNVYKINYKNYFTGSIYYQLLKKDTDMVFSSMVKTASGESATANKILINKQTTNGWSVVTSITLDNSDEWQTVSIPIAKSLLTNAIAWRIEFAHTEATTDDAALEVCMMQLEEGFTPHDYIPYSPATVNNLIFPEPLRSLPNGTKDIMTKNGIVRAVGKYTLQSSKTGTVVFSSNPSYIIAIGQTGIYIKDDISSVPPQFYCNRFKNVDALDDIMIVRNNIIISNREKEGIGITDTQFAICIRADLVGAVITDTEVQLKTKFNTWLDANPVILYYEKEHTELESLTQLQINTINNLTTRQLYDAWTIDGDFDVELELTYRSSTNTQTIEPWVTASNLLNKTNLYKDNNIHTKSYIEVDNGDATKSGITATRPVYLLNSGTTAAELNIKFDYINIISPLTIKVIKGKFDDEGFNEIAQVSEITIKSFATYKPFLELYDGNPDNWYIEIDSELQEIYLKHKTDTTQILSLNKFNENCSFLTLADCNFVDYNKVFPTIISEIEGTAIENTIFNKVVLGLSTENYRLKNASLEWKHTYL